MNFPSLEYLEALRSHLNNLEAFRKATEWADVNVAVKIGDHRYWMKIYRGQVIDLMEDLPMTNPLGYRVIISGDEAAWRELKDGTAKTWALTTTGRLVIDGDLIEANRIHEALCLIVEATADI